MNPDIVPTGADRTSQLVASSPATSDGGVINVSAAFRRMGGDRELMCDMATFFLNDAPRLVERIRTALAAEASEDGARAAHSLKGLAANFDASGAQELAACVEQHCLAREFDAARALLDELDRQVTRVSNALRAEVLTG